MHADLAAEEKYTVAKFSKEFCNYAFNIEDVVLLAIDVLMLCCTGIRKERYATPTGLKRYTNRTTYDVAEDKDLFEWAIPTDLSSRFDKCTTSESVSLIISSYETRVETSLKRLSLFLSISGFCTGIASKEDPFNTRFVEKLALIASNLNIEVTPPPRDKIAKPIS